MSGELQFNEERHEYSIGGRVLPNVTSILERVGIVDYSFIPPATRDMALERGSAVHAAIALDLEGDLDEASVEPIMGYVEAARAARRDLGVEKPEAFEKRGYHPQYLYAGTLDLVTPEILLDWKTNGAEWWVRLQIAAYEAMQPNPGTRTRIAVALFDDGTYSFKDTIYKCSDYRRDFNDFLAALRVVQMIDEHRKGKRA